VWNQLALVASLGFLAPVLALLTVILVGGSQTMIEVAGKAVVASMAFWAVGDVAMMSLQLFQLSRECERVLDRCQAALTGPGDNVDNESLTAFDEYNCAVSKAPPIPYRAYKQWGDGLNEARKQRKAEAEVAMPQAPAPAGP